MGQDIQDEEEKHEEHPNDLVLVEEEKRYSGGAYALFPYEPYFILRVNGT